MPVAAPAGDPAPAVKTPETKGNDKSSKAPAEAKPAVEAPAKPPVEKEVTWTLKKGKLSGPGAWVAGKKISTIKNPKTPGSTSEICHHYGKFAVVEVQSTDEKGALDLFVRYPSDKDKNLCNPDFNGKYVGLSVLEGYFAGVAGDYAVVDGFDDSEGLLDFQIFSLETGKEVFRSSHHPTEEFALTKRGDKSSLIFFSKIKVSCELGKDEKGECWKKILKENGLKKIAAPDCKVTFAKANQPLEEQALVTVRSRVANLAQPKIELLGTRAICSPAP